MSTHKYIDRICCAILIVVLLLTAAFVNAGKFGVVPVMAQAGYEGRLFDTSKVHTIDIVMDDWDSFLDTCENEEYAACAVVIDNEAYKNVGIRAKGNTSLRSVSAYGNDRYSFKLEFDCYENGKTYHGLDKISLNNIIQDNTYMKDYLTYQMMGDMGVAAPLCSYVYITVNGEDWGLYLAVEGVEEGFLARNYGNDYGNLYKPDSMDMGGGRGNGGKFEMDDWEGPPETFGADGRKEPPQSLNGENSGTVQEGKEPEPPGEKTREEVKDTPFGRERDFQGEKIEMPAVSEKVREGEIPERPEQPQEGEMPGRPEQPQEGEIPGRPERPAGNGRGPEFGNPGAMAFGSTDVALIYSDDAHDSYKNIFDNAKTEVSDGDKDRLIDSLRKLSQGEDIETIVDVEAVIKYFVVHNFVCNFDSYTGSMIHNYYLYEKDGKMSMIPWDYNLAFGGFENQADAEEMVNYPVDSPVSGGDLASRPMIAWIFADETYTEMYHQYFTRWIEEYFSSGYFEKMITDVKEMIAPYVEKDPTRFCTYEEFEEGSETLKQFCLLRAESVRGQLSGLIPSTAEGQAQDKDSLVDASDLSLGAMGRMDMGGGRR